MIPLIKSIYNNLYDRRKLVFFILIIVGFFFLGQKTLNKNPNVDKNDHQYVNSIYMSDGRIYNNYLNDEEKAMYDFMMDRMSIARSPVSNGVLKRSFIDIHPRFNCSVIHQNVADAFLLKICNQTNYVHERGF